MSLAGVSMMDATRKLLNHLLLETSYDHHSRTTKQNAHPFAASDNAMERREVSMRDATRKLLNHLLLETPMTIATQPLNKMHIPLQQDYSFYFFSLSGNYLKILMGCLFQLQCLERREACKGAKEVSKKVAPSRKHQTTSTTIWHELVVKNVAELKLSMNNLEKERDFYFAKLRDIKIFCQKIDVDCLLVNLKLLLCNFQGPSGFGCASIAEEVTRGIDVAHLTTIVIEGYLKVLYWSHTNVQ
eukprot:Gb_38812 [translate_table: standard]